MQKIDTFAEQVFWWETSGLLHQTTSEECLGSSEPLWVLMNFTKILTSWIWSIGIQLKGLQQSELLHHDEGALWGNTVIVFQWFWLLMEVRFKKVNYCSRMEPLICRISSYLCMNVLEEAIQVTCQNPYNTQFYLWLPLFSSGKTRKTRKYLVTF